MDEPTAATIDASPAEIYVRADWSIATCPAFTHGCDVKESVTDSTVVSSAEEGIQILSTEVSRMSVEFVIPGGDRSPVLV